MQKIDSQLPKLAYRIIPMQIDDVCHQKAVINIWKNNFSACNASIERYDWLYRCNPYGQINTWLLVTDKEEIVGCSSLFPRELWVQNNNVLTWSAADLAVNKQHRFLGPALSLQKAVVSMKFVDDAQFIFGHPNKAAQGVMKRVKYKPIGKESCWTKPLLAKEKIKKYLRNSFLLSILEFFYSIFLELLYWKEKLLFSPTYYSKIIATCDDKFDILWAECRAEYGITPVKNSKYLNWRFANHKDRAIKFYCLFDSDENLLGYIAFSVLNRAVTIEDLCVKNLRKNSRMILLAFSREMKASGHTAILLSYLGDDFFKKILKTLFFFQRRLGNISFVYFHPECPREYQGYILNEGNWFLVGDFDI